MPGKVTVEMEFAFSRRPESGNTFRPGVAMILQSFEVLCEDTSGADICVAALFGDSITHTLGELVRSVDCRNVCGSSRESGNI